jgi:hypothetical protein
MDYMDAKTLKNEVFRALELEARERFKKLKQIGYAAKDYLSSLKEPSAEELNDGSEIFTTIMANSPRTDALRIFNAELAKITQKHLGLRGYSQAPILFKKSTTVPLDGCSLAIGDLFYANNSFKMGDEIPLMNQGHCYMFYTEGDAEYNIQIRVVEAPEPVLTPDEHENIVGASPVVTLHFPTGKLYVDVTPNSWGTKPAVEADIAPGNYKCQVFVFEVLNKDSDCEEDYDCDYPYCFVLSKTNSQVGNNEKELIDLSPIRA